MAEDSEFQVFAGVRWADTGLVIEAGDRVTVTYLEGRWTANSVTGTVTAEGNPRYIAKPGYSLPGQPEGLLVGRVEPAAGEDEIFVIGTGAEVPASLTGRLRLSINDDLFQRYGRGFLDNVGFVKVRISVES